MERALRVAFGVLYLSTLPILAFAQDDEVESEDEAPVTIEYVVIGESANLRAGAGTSFNVVDTLSTGESVLIYDEQPVTAGWYRVYRPNEDDAYIADFLVERAPTRFYDAAQEPVIVASGQGANITDVYDLPAGAYRVDATIQDSSFILSTVVTEGDCRDSNIFNELYMGQNQMTMSGLLVSSGCSLLFETDNVDGEWTLEVRNIIDEGLLDTALSIETGTSITGFGRALTMPTILSEGIWKISATVEDRAFILWARAIGDCEEEAIFNELNFDVDLLEASATYRVDSGNCLVFWETSNVEDDWEIEFEQLR